MQEYKSDFSKRISGLVLESDLSKSILNNSKLYLFNALDSAISAAKDQFNEWKVSAQKSIDSLK